MAKSLKNIKTFCYWQQLTSYVSESTETILSQIRLSFQASMYI